MRECCLKTIEHLQKRKDGNLVKSEKIKEHTCAIVVFCIATMMVIAVFVSLVMVTVQSIAYLGESTGLWLPTSFEYQQYLEITNE